MVGKNIHDPRYGLTSPEGPPPREGKRLGEGRLSVVLCLKDETLADMGLLLSPNSTPELPRVVILDARKKGPLGLTSTFLLTMHLGERSAMRN